MTSRLDRRAFMAAGAAAIADGAIRPARAADAPATAPGPPPVEAYAGSPVVAEIALSPDGAHVAVITETKQGKVLLNFDMTGKAKTQSLGFGDVKMRSLFWADNEHVIAMTSQTTALAGFAGYKHEFYLARSINMTTHKVATLFNNQEHFYNIVTGDLNRIKVDGAWKITASNYQMQDPFNLCLYSFDLDHEYGQLMCEAGPDTEGFVVDPDGWVMAYSDFDDDHKEWVLYFNQAGPGESKRFRPVYRMKDALSTPSLEGIGRDGKSALIFINRGEAKGEYHEISAEGVLGPPLGDNPKSLSTTALFHPVTRRLAGFCYHDDWFTYDYSDPLLKKLTDALPQVMGADALCSIADFGDDPRKMIIYAEGEGDPGAYYYADFSTGNVQLIANNYPDLPPEWVSRKEAIDYKAADGLNIHAYLTLPPQVKTAGNLPLVVLPHGGPEARDFIDFDWQAQVLASRGYAVLQPNFRGSTGYGQAFIDASHGEFGRKMQTDLSDGVRYLASQGTIDPKRVAILGASYGGYAALAGATLDPGIYRCAVSVAGVSDTRSFIGFLAENENNDYHSSRVLYWKQLVGDPKGWDETSPARQADKAYCPILMLHGTDDTVVPIDQSQRMEKALKAAGKPVEFITYKGQDHWETIGPARIEMMKTALDFIQKYNPAKT